MNNEMEYALRVLREAEEDNGASICTEMSGEEYHYLRTGCMR